MKTFLSKTSEKCLKEECESFCQVGLTSELASSGEIAQYRFRGKCWFVASPHGATQEDRSRHSQQRKNSFRRRVA